MKKTNEQLEQQALTLRESEERLRSQREELRNTNEELQEKATLLAQQKSEVEAKNREVEEARWAIEEKAEQLAITSKYKSEFMANMSHELRTPLNSMLILSRQLAENGESTLTPKQIQFAETIHSSGNDLLFLINDILDLSKIESGMMNIEASEVSLSEVNEQLNRSFYQVAHDKGLEFNLSRDAILPSSIVTDQKRLQQILRNLLSNAFKFTEKGRVSLQIKAADKRTRFMIDSLNESDEVIAFSVADTGIGIPADKQQIIFEAFQQADGTTSRKYGGTGLGLSISREIARLLGGEIRVSSVPGQGSVFTLHLPRQQSLPAESPVEQLGEWRSSPLNSRLVGLHPDPVEYAPATETVDDRVNIAPGERTLLIIEDDALFAQVLLDVAHEKGFKGLIANRGDLAIILAHKYKPDAITLDIKLPDQDGWTVLDRLKHDRQTSHIPVHIISACEARGHLRSMGAVTHLQKPVSREELENAFDRISAFSARALKRLLVVEENETQRKSIVELIGGSDVETTSVGTSREAIAALQGDQFDCMVLDLHLPDMSGFDLMRKAHVDLGLSDLPIIVYTGKSLSAKEESELRQMTDEIIVKEAASPERLLAETAIFLHRVEASMPEPKRRMIEHVRRHDPLLVRRKVLVIDDDARNIFALSSVLESFEMEVCHAENGREGIKLLNEAPDVDLVLLDIMMPELDGYEAIKAIRAIKGFEALPIIALTAKAMKADRDKCIEAGASDYISKPLDVDQLISLLRVWLNRHEKAGA